MLEEFKDSNGLSYHVPDGKKQILMKDFIKYLKDLNYPECYIGINFISENLYENEVKENLDKEVQEAYNKGRMERARIEEKDKTYLKVIGFEYHKIYNELLKTKKLIYYSGYGLQDAMFFGMDYLEYRKINNTIDDIENRIEEAIELVQIALGIDLDKEAWKKLEE